MNLGNYYQNPELWGPSTWYLLHVLSYTFEEKQRKQYERFFNTFKDLIPCPKCREDYNNYIKNKKPDFSSKENFIKWISDVHNHVNQKLGKRVYNQDYINHLYVEDNKVKPIQNHLIYRFVSIFSKTCFLNNLSVSKCQNLFMSLIKIYPDIEKRKIFEPIYKMDNNILWNNVKFANLIVRSISLKIL